jgi:hypothetical protein
MYTTVTIRFGKGGIEGTVRYCDFREIGYYVGVRFAEGQRWTKHKFMPKHMFDPRRLLVANKNRTKAMPA